nr:hypothetical protein [Secundilactobacillus silagei]
MIAGWLILLTPIHGYSDNGDFQRFMATNDLYSLHQVQAGYVVQQYGLMKYYNPLHLEHLTVQSVVIQLAVGLNRLFYSHSRFDIRFLGAVHYGLYLGGVAVLVKGLVGEKKSVTKLRHCSSRNVICRRFVVYAVLQLVLSTDNDVYFTALPDWLWVIG